MAKIYSSKSLDLQMYGKLITIYPKNEEDFKLHIENLYQLLKKYKGLNISVDKQYKNSIIFYRFGTNHSKRPYFVNPITQKKRTR
ncbi:class III lanthionine synthetase LanKC N-terminal domain-containing protein [Mesomycoplasma hyorhinis]|uniref:class III lanthionine synthetase LanKC N-terminal domain-containing protein n=1 Tax=Mesomycoplasma hyorhinis TaxID=2100 RepID=UPI003FEF0FDE